MNPRWSSQFELLAPIGARYHGLRAASAASMACCLCMCSSRSLSLLSGVGRDIYTKYVHTFGESSPTAAMIKIKLEVTMHTNPRGRVAEPGCIGANAIDIRGVQNDVLL